MIQRVQSIYLLLAAILMAVSIFTPIIEVVYDQNIVTLYARGLFFENTFLKATWGILSVSILSFICNLFSIFLFKNRKIQKLFVKMSIALNILLYITIAFYVYSYTQMTISDFHLSIVCPLLALVLNFMAINGIRKDEKLIKSLDRIR